MLRGVVRTLERCCGNAGQNQAHDPNIKGGMHGEQLAVWRGKEELLLQAWRAGEFNARLWQDMIKFLPASFEGNLTHPRNALVAHSGKGSRPRILYKRMCLPTSNVIVVPHTDEHIWPLALRTM